jgi:hypothetical protein
MRMTGSAATRNFTAPLHPVMPHAVILRRCRDNSAGSAPVSVRTLAQTQTQITSS